MDPATPTLAPLTDPVTILRLAEPEAVHVVRVALAEEHPSMRRSLRRVLEAAPGIQVVAEACDLAELDDAMRRLAPDVVVLDLRLHGGSVVEFIRAATAPPRATRIVGTTLSRNSIVAAEALRVGVEAIVLKDLADDELAQAVEAAALGERYVSSRLRCA